MRLLARLPFGLGLLLLAGCAGGVKPLAVFTGREAPPAHEVTVQIDPPQDGVSKIRLSCAEFPGAVCGGEAIADGEGWRIDLDKLEWFNNWPNGWTHASFRLNGRAALQRTEAGWTLATIKAPELDMVESASIRYFDTYVRGEAGLREFSHRWDRIKAAASDISTRVPDASLLRDPNSLRKYLFPEIYGYEVRPDPAHAKLPAEGVVWNTDYTKQHFAEPLQILRDSGTLLRDYKESPGLWLLALEWTGFWEGAGQAIVLQKE
jgi:hypothetical protein